MCPQGFAASSRAKLRPQSNSWGNYGGKQYIWQGSLLRTEAAIDPNSNTVQAIIRVQQPVAETGLIPLPIGLFVEAKIAGRRIDNVVALPRSVIRNNSQVLVVDAENKMYYRDVDIFRLEQDRVLISGGPTSWRANLHLADSSGGRWYDGPARGRNYLGRQTHNDAKPVSTPREPAVKSQSIAP
jgi:hypothetical protein